jgi:hypothetical protein
LADIGDQFSEKTVVLMVKGLKFGAKELAKVVDKLLKGTDNLVKKITTPQDMTGKGEQTVKQLVRQGQGVSNIEINDKNIKSFESVARKYGVDFALKKDTAETPPKWLVFFKAKDADALTAAFKEFTVKEAKRSKAKKPSVVKDLAEKAAKVKIPVVDKVKNKARGGHEL